LQAYGYQKEAKAKLAKWYTSNGKTKRSYKSTRASNVPTTDASISFSIDLVESIIDAISRKIKKMFEEYGSPSRPAAQ